VNDGFGEVSTSPEHSDLDDIPINHPDKSEYNSWSLFYFPVDITPSYSNCIKWKHLKPII